MIERRSRYDLEAIGHMDTEYVPMKAWELDQIHGALKPLDAKADEMERRWGKGRLETLVSPETAAKFEAARAKLDVAIHDREVELVIKRAGIMQRGWDALEKEAIERGHKAAPPELWYATAPDEFGEKELQIVIAQDNSAATLAETDLPVYTVTEIARIVRAWRSKADADAAKQNFPGAEVVRIDGDEPFDDEIPF
jgi:hypothetical protein